MSRGTVVLSIAGAEDPVTARQAATIVESVFDEMGVRPEVSVDVVGGAPGLALGGRFVPAQPRVIAGALGIAADRPVDVPAELRTVADEAVAPLVRAIMWHHLVPFIDHDLRVGALPPSQRDAVRTFGFLGAAPSDTIDTVGGIDDDGPGLMQRALGAFAEWSPVIRVSRATMDRIVGSTEPERGQRAYRVTKTRKIRLDLFHDAGATFRDLGLEIADVPAGIVEVGIGSYRAMHRLPPPDLVAIDAHPTTIPPHLVDSSFVEPLYGEQWCLVRRQAVAAVERRHLRVFWDVPYLARLVQTEIATRAGLFVPPDSVTPMMFNNQLGARITSVGYPARRLLAANGGPANTSAAIAEGVVRSLAQGESDPTCVQKEIRLLLGSGVIGGLASTADFELVELPDETATDAVRCGHVAPLLPLLALDRDPGLTRVVICPASLREDLSWICRPLWPSVVVVGDAELAPHVRPLLRRLGRHARTPARVGVA